MFCYKERNAINKANFVLQIPRKCSLKPFSKYGSSVLQNEVYTVP